MVAAAASSEPRNAGGACACAGSAAMASAPTPASGLTNLDVVRDADVGGERGGDRAILLEGEVDRAASLHFVRSLAGDGEEKVDGRVAARLRLAARPFYPRFERAPVHAPLLEGQHDVRRGARRRSNEQHFYRRRRDGAVAVDDDPRAARRSGLNQQPG